MAVILRSIVGRKVGLDSSDNLVVAAGIIYGNASTPVILSPTELSALDGITAGTVTASKVVIVDASKVIAGFGSIGVDGTAVNSLLGMITIGTVVTATGANVSANTNRVAGVSVNLWNSAATITGLRGVDSRVRDDGGTGSANLVGVQGIARKASGTGSGELWGGNFIAGVIAGKVENAYGVVGELTVDTAGFIGTAGAPIGYVTGVLAALDVASAATLAGSASPDAATVVAPSIALLRSAATNRKKADGAYVAILGGDGAGSEIGTAHV